MKMRLAVLLLLLAWSAAPAGAVMIENVDIADSIVVDGQTFRLNGAGLRSVPVIGIDVYIAALYLTAPSHDAAAIMASPAPKVVVIHFLHSATKAQLEHSFRNGEQENCGNGECDPSERPDFERLVAAAQAVQPGDATTYIYYSNRLRVLQNGRPIGDYANGPLSQQLLRGFLGQHPPTERLKRQMLGLAPE